MDADGFNLWDTKTDAWKALTNEGEWKRNEETITDICGCERREYRQKQQEAKT